MAADVSWSPDEFTAPGGQYRLCWCAGGFSCVTSEDFKVDVAGLIIQGVASKAQAYTCVMGQVCSVDGIRGHLLTDDDVIMVLETCGTAAGIRGLPGGGVVTNVHTSGMSFDWSTSVLTAYGGGF